MAEVWSVALAKSGATQHRHVSQWLRSSKVASRYNQGEGKGYTRESITPVCKLTNTGTVIVTIVIAVIVIIRGRLNRLLIIVNYVINNTNIVISSSYNDIVIIVTINNVIVIAIVIAVNIFLAMFFSTS